MFFSYNGISVFYKRHMGPGAPVILMHGWGGSNVSFSGTYEFLCGLNRDVIALDFPGFGSSDLPPADWGIENYIGCVDFLINSLKLRKVILVGHSFGGRVALGLGDKEYVDGIVLVDSAGLKPIPSLVKKIKVMRYKKAKKSGKDVSKFGSKDYLSLPESMKSVFVKVVNTFFDDKLKDIFCPVLIIWGKKDDQTPLYMARRLKRKIKGSMLILLDGGHFAYAENNIKFNLILGEFTKGGRQCLFG